MFDEYQQILDEAKAREQAIETEHDKTLEENALEIQKRMSDEVAKMSKDVLLKNYNPVEYYNEITKLKHAYDKLVKEKESEIEALKREVDSKLLSLTRFNPTSHVKEFYKIIPNCSNVGYFVRVWFSLISFKCDNGMVCNPGDAIRIERTTNDKNVKVVESRSCFPNTYWVFYIPNFEHSTYVNPSSSLIELRVSADINKLKFDTEPESCFDKADRLKLIEQYSWWLEWVKANRPIPE